MDQLIKKLLEDKIPISMEFINSKFIFQILKNSPSHPSVVLTKLRLELQNNVSLRSKMFQGCPPFVFTLMLYELMEQEIELFRKIGVMAYLILSADYDLINFVKKIRQRVNSGRAIIFEPVPSEQYLLFTSFESGGPHKITKQLFDQLSHESFENRDEALACLCHSEKKIFLQGSTRYN